MTEQSPKYHLYAIRTADLPQGALKGFQYSLQANNRYALIFTDKELAQPYKMVADGVKLEKEEQEWLTACKSEIISRAMKENETEYATILNSFCDKLDEELKAEKEKISAFSE